MLKTADWGYDGKGQAKIALAGRCSRLCRAEFAGGEAILEAFIDFECEISVVAARGCDGSFATYGPIENSHSRHILDLSVCPAAVPPRVARRGRRDRPRDLAAAGGRRRPVRRVLRRSQRPLMVNELAPRPHNSGHLTIDACTTCQFEQQVRAVCGLPLGSPRQHRPAAMANLLGDLWQAVAHSVASTRHAYPTGRRLAQGDVKLHLYGKAEPRIGRKMGHLTALADTPRSCRASAAARRPCAHHSPTHHYSTRNAARTFDTAPAFRANDSPSRNRLGL